MSDVQSRFGRLDILVNNAGSLVRRCAAVDIDDAYFDAVIGTNLYSMVACWRTAIPGMVARGSGSIINVSSIAARTGGGAGAALYAAAKAAVATFTRGLAREVAPAGVRVNVISPGVVLTPFHERFSTPEVLAGLVASIPLARRPAPMKWSGPRSSLHRTR